MSASRNGEGQARDSENSKDQQSNLADPFTVDSEKLGTEGSLVGSSLPSTEQVYRRRDVEGDMFVIGVTASLAHCVSADLHMGKGIAVTFKNKFGGLGELKEQNPTVGSVVLLKRGDRYIYYLVTKPRYFNKPTYATLRDSLQAMKAHCVTHGVRDLVMPRIGCGLDRLQYGRVGPMIDEVYKDVPITITVCQYVPG